MFCILQKHFFTEVCICVLVFALANMYTIVHVYYLYTIVHVYYLCACFYVSKHVCNCISIYKMSAKIFEKSSFSPLLFLLLKSKTQILKHFLQFQNVSLILISSWTTKMVCEYSGISFMIRLLWDMSVFLNLYQYIYISVIVYKGWGALYVFKNLYSQLNF